VKQKIRVSPELTLYSSIVNRFTTIVPLLFGCIIILFFAQPSDAAKKKEWQTGVMQIRGNYTFRSATLFRITYLKPAKVFSKTRFSEWRLRSDVDVMRKFYRSQGFMESNITIESMTRDTTKMKVNIIILVDEGPRTGINNVYLKANDSIFDSTIITRLSCRKGSFLMSSLISNDLKLIKEQLASKGFLDGIAVPDVIIDSSRYLADITFTVLEGPQIKVGSVKIDGLKKLRTKFVSRELNFREGDILTSDRIRRTENNLYRTNLLNSVQIDHVIDSTGNLYTRGNSQVTVNVKELDFFKLQLGIGYIYYGEGYKYYEGIRGSLETSYSNLFRLGHQLTLKADGAFPKQKADLIYRTPWFFGIPLQFASRLYLDRMTTKNLDSALIRGIELSFNYQPNSHLEYLYKLDWQDQVWFKGKDYTSSPQKMTKIIGAEITYDNRDDIVDPSRGVYNIVTIDFAGWFDKSSNRYLKLTNDISVHWKWDGLIFGSGLQLGLIYAYDTTLQAIPPQEQFSLGGTKILRAYEQDEFHIDKGIKVAANLLEMRFPIIWWFNGALFVDAGKVWEFPNQNVHVKDIKWCGGPGLRIKTPIAIARVDMGIKFENKPFRDLYRFQIDIGHAF
jgi:outer membrane protein assembly factor BamA